jgi:hypothetical protein
MVSAHEYLTKYSKYKEDFYADNNKLFCKYCSHIVNHERKSTLDEHLRTQVHASKKQASINNNNNNSHQTTLPTYQKKIIEKQKINYELVEAFAEANIPLEKIEKLKPFLKNNCQNGNWFF